MVMPCSWAGSRTTLLWSNRPASSLRSKTMKRTRPESDTCQVDGADLRLSPVLLRGLTQPRLSEMLKMNRHRGEIPRTHPVQPRVLRQGRGAAQVRRGHRLRPRGDDVTSA
uniref:Uncharacterized protein n=1 Tax=mine drainage metagenome TaxID=410659 RepID=E6PUK3_9ZZZZ